MADAVDSKSTEGNLMRVRLPPPAPSYALHQLKVDLSYGWQASTTESEIRTMACRV